jgi:methionyl-tRNA formyltransferase
MSSYKRIRKSNFSRENRGDLKKIIYVGTDKWSMQLSRLAESEECSIVHAVVPLKSGPLREICEKLDISYTESNNVNDLELLISKLEFDLYVIVGHPFLLRKPLLDIADGIGFHPSLLPKRRGRAPLNWAIIDGLTTSGVTIFKLAKGADEGLIYFQEEFPITKTDTTNDLIDKVNIILSKNLQDIILKWPDLEGIVQDDNEATYTPRRYPDDSEINMDMTADEAERLVRAMHGPYPSAFIRLNNSQKLYIHDASIENKKN